MLRRLSRREFVRDLAALGAGGGIAVRSQRSAAEQPKSPRRIGILVWGRPFPEKWKEVFLKALKDRGYVEGRDVVLVERTSYGSPERLPALAAELVQEKVAVIVCTVSEATRAAKLATSTIPIVMLFVGDPVGLGLVASLSRPGGNITGLSGISVKLTPKRLELAKDGIPGLSRVVFMYSPDYPYRTKEQEDLTALAPRLSLELTFLTVQTPADFEKAFSEIAKVNAQALFLSDDAFFPQHRRILLELAAKARLPVLGWVRDYVNEGGLLFYGADHADMVAQSVGYIDKIFKGANAGDLPISQPTKFQLVVNLKAARALGIAVPPEFLSRADEVIE
jgi:putative ABC transport system substrate-binding protein